MNDYEYEIQHLKKQVKGAMYTGIFIGFWIGFGVGAYAVKSGSF